MKKLFLYLSAARRYLLSLAALALVTATASLCYLRESVSLAGTPATGDWDGDNDSYDKDDCLKAYDEIWHDENGGPSGRDANGDSVCDWSDFWFGYIHGTGFRNAYDLNGDDEIVQSEVETVLSNLQYGMGNSLSHAPVTSTAGWPIPLDPNGDEEIDEADAFITTWSIANGSYALQSNGDPACDPNGGFEVIVIPPAATHPFDPVVMYGTWPDTHPLGDVDDDGIPNLIDPQSDPLVIIQNTTYGFYNLGDADGDGEVDEEELEDLFPSGTNPFHVKYKEIYG